MVRLMFHTTGNYDPETGTGGSDGGRLRFTPESTDPQNRGLQVDL